MASLIGVLSCHTILGFLCLGESTRAQCFVEAETYIHVARAHMPNLLVSKMNNHPIEKTTS